MCKIAITTQEGSNTAREWNKERRDAHESSATKKSKSRKERRARIHEKYGGTGKARAKHVKPPCPTPEALTCVQLQRVEVDQREVHNPGMTVKSSSRTDQSKQYIEQIAYNDERHDAGVRSDSQPPLLVSCPLREWLGSSNVCPNQARGNNWLGLVKTDQVEASRECRTKSNGQDSLRDEPQKRASNPAQPVTLSVKATKGWYKGHRRSKIFFF